MRPLDEDLLAQARQHGHGAAVAAHLQVDARLPVLVEGLDGGELLAAGSGLVIALGLAFMIGRRSRKKD